MPIDPSILSAAGRLFYDEGLSLAEKREALRDMQRERPELFGEIGAYIGDLQLMEEALEPIDEAISSEVPDLRVQSSRGDEQPVRVWCGDYRFACHDPFFKRAVKAGQTYVDENARGNPVSAEGFRAEMGELRKMAPADGQVLLDELEHRWAYPKAPPTLYVVTCELCVHHRFALVAGAEEFGQEALSTKVGRARRSLAPRLGRYDEEGIAGVSITKDSLALRVVIYGHGPSMVSEGELKQIAKRNGVLLERVDEGGERQRVTTESYAGVAMLEAICAFACERASA